MFISHVGPDSGALAAWLQRELTAQGLTAFLDADSISVGADWAEGLRRAVWSCRVFIVLVSPGFFLHHWPVRELRTALRRAAQTQNNGEQPPAISILPVYVRWTRSEAAAVLQQAAQRRATHLPRGFTRADGSRTQGSFVLQPSATSDQVQELGSQQPAAQALALLQQLQRFQHPASRNSRSLTLRQHGKQEVDLVEELTDEVLHILPKQFKAPAGTPFCKTKL